MSTPFREKNPVVVGAVSLAVIALLILAAFRAQDLPLIGGGDTYYAAFSESVGSSRTTRSGSPASAWARSSRSSSTATT